MNKIIWRIILTFVSLLGGAGIGCFVGFLPGGPAAGAVIIFVLLVGLIIAAHIRFDEDYIVQGTPGTGRYYSAEEYRKSTLFEKKVNSYLDK